MWLYKPRIDIFISSASNKLPILKLNESNYVRFKVKMSFLKMWWFKTRIDVSLTPETRWKIGLIVYT